MAPLLRLVYKVYWDRRGGFALFYESERDAARVYLQQHSGAVTVTHLSQRDVEKLMLERQYALPSIT